jgi:N6-adenosine-specific RNA methylase IME4
VTADLWQGLTPPYGTIVIDPPWHYDTTAFNDAPMPYSTMSLDEICRLPVIDLASPGAHLFLWTTNRYLWDARDVCLGWGFDPVMPLVWCKPSGGVRPGGVFAPTTEYVVYARRSVKAKRQIVRAGALIREAREAAGLNRSDLHRAVRGGTPTGIVFRWEDDDSLPNEADWCRLVDVLPTLAEVERPYVEPVEPKALGGRQVESSWWTWPTRGHSVKPPEFLDVIDSRPDTFPGPKVEIFAREPRLGWDSWGFGYEAARLPA